MKRVSGHRLASPPLLLGAARLGPQLVAVDHVAASADEAAGRLDAALARRRWRGRLALPAAARELVRLGLAAAVPRLGLGRRRRRLRGRG